LTYTERISWDARSVPTVDHDKDGPMRAYRRVAATRRGGPQVLELVEEPARSPLLAEARIPLDDVRRAHERLGHGEITGKIVIVPAGSP
jgi:hypothetical protein